MRAFRDIILFISFVMMSGIAYAVPAQQAWMEATTQSGEIILVTLRGDEFYHWYEDLNGNYWEKNDQGLLHMETAARLSKRQEQAQARRIQQQYTTNTDFPKTGTVHVVVLLAQYADKSFVIQDPVEQFTNLYNEHRFSQNGSTGSVRDYYLASSNNMLDVQFDVYGPYTLSKNEEYYGGNTKSSNNKNAQELVKEVTKLAETAGVDFTKYDNKNSGYVDLVAVVTAGHNEAEGGEAKSIWPHQSTVWNTTRVSGKILTAYLMTSELRGYKGHVMANIGTFCHEFGHVLGLPDLYDTKNKEAYTVGTWDVMCSGCYNNNSRTPPVYSAFERFMLGWMTPQQLNAPMQYKLGSLEQTNSAYIFAKTNSNLTPFFPNPSEYFMIENRQREGWDSISSCLPGTGLLISHITFSQDRWYSNTFNNYTPLGYDVVEAIQPGQTQAASASDTYPGKGGVTSFLPTLNNGQVLTNYQLSNIFERADGKVSFFVGNASDLKIQLTPQVPDTFVSTFDKKVIEYDEQTVTIYGKDLSSELLQIRVTGRFYLSWDGETWGSSGDTLTDSIQDGNYQRDLHIRYTPSRQLCSATTGLLTIFTADSTDYLLRTLYGIAPRPNYLTAVDTIMADKQSTSSFRATWTEVEDAEYYYLTLYRGDKNDTTVTYTEQEQREVMAPNTATTFSDLRSGTFYRVAIQAAEQKSCFENISPSKEMLTSTLKDVKEDSRIPVVITDDGRYILLTETALPEGTHMAIYDSEGMLMHVQTLATGVINPDIPVDKLCKGHLYLIKLFADRMSRKDLWAKFIYKK